MRSVPCAEALEKRRLFTNYVVSPTGSDTNPGTPDLPWATLQHAADSVAPGDSVTVLPGQYSGFQLSTSGTADQPISFAAASGVVINAPIPTRRMELIWKGRALR